MYEQLGDLLAESDAAVVDPRLNEIHTVYSSIRSWSLHAYPGDDCYSIGYVSVEEETAGEGRYERKRFEIREST